MRTNDPIFLNMSRLLESARQEPVIAGFVLTPLALFCLLLLLPPLDALLRLDVQFQFYIHYYALAFSGFVAVIIALYSSGVFGQRARARMQFVTLAFGAMAVLLLLSGLTTPNLLVGEAGLRISAWSLHLSLPVGALFFALAGVRWRPTAEAWLEKWTVWVWLAAAGLLAGSVWLATAVSPIFPGFSQSLAGRSLGVGVGLATIALYLWSAGRIRVDFASQYTFSHRLGGTLLLLAEAQFVLLLGRADGLSGAFIYPLLVLALLVAVWAVLSTLRGTENLQVSRYFAAAGSVLSVGFSLLLGEFVINVFDLQEQRTAILFTLLVEATLSFLILYVIVVHLERLVRLRTVDYLREQRLRTELTQMVIHDLKSPLSVIRSSIGLLLKGYLGEMTPRQFTVLTRADESTQRILQLIDNLLDVERLEIGALPMHSREIETAPWLREALAQWEVVAEAHRLTLRLAIAPTLPPLFGDRDLLQRVINNLLTNAVNYAATEGEVMVTAVADGPHLLITVADDGPGVPDEEKERIFEKFAQVDSANRRGSGLGLTFCRMVVQAHDGRLTVTDNPAGGAIFRLSLPASQARADWTPHELELLERSCPPAVPALTEVTLPADER